MPVHRHQVDDLAAPRDRRARGPVPAAPTPDVPAKFAVPVATHVVARPRLHARLDAGVADGVVLIAAGPGWGKSLLVGSWVAAGAGGRGVAWVSLDAGDDDARAFWRTVATALAQVAGDRVARALARLPSGAGELPGDLVRALDGTDPLVVVLDNLHEVADPEVHAGLQRLVEHPPPGLALVITTRRDPAWALPRLRLAGLVTEIRAADLAFDRDEAAALFDHLGVDLGTGQLDEMVRRTEGWAAGLRLGALHLRGAPDVDAAVGAFSGDDHDVSGYLLDEILDHQPPGLVTFLERVAVVDLVCADLADALVGGHDGAAVLADLAASHLFVQALGPGRWYRLHRLVLDLLRARPLPRRERRDLHRRASTWFAAHGTALEAVRAAVRGELWPLASELVSRHLLALALGGSGRELERVLAEVPRHVLLAQPELATALAGARISRAHGVEVARLVEAARTSWGGLSARRIDRLRLFHALILGGLARMDGDPAASRDALRAVELDAAALAALDVADVDVVLDVVRSNLGTAAFWIGDLEEAETHLREVADLRGARALPPLNAAAHLALIAVGRGELDAAEQVATAVVDAAEAAGWTLAIQVAPAYLALARVVFDRGDTDGADTWWRRLAEVEEQGPERPLQLAGALLRALRHDAAGDAGRGLAELRSTRARLGGWAPPRPLREQAALTEAALLARVGELPAARLLLGREGPPETDAGRLLLARLHRRLEDPEAARDVLAGVRGDAVRTRVDAGVVGALLADEAGDEDRAADLLEDALVAAAPHGLRRPFLAEPDLAPLLARRLERGTAAGGFALELLGRPTPTRDTAGVVDPLTERERLALRYLASSLANTEIAAALYVSVNTVKTHQRAVYRKLGADGRRDAVRRARELGLL
ncbi:LuxR C-terminal-related transcriptional regulator [Actinomycetospora sp. CA-101289]|uniref:LuxR C-terminal-related transcriptional regulator n=1 Tax=Actinomycetospora sp. CA-101289 TaxID=3239893 RepID=UPI003D99080E